MPKKPGKSTTQKMKRPKIAESTVPVSKAKFKPTKAYFRPAGIGKARIAHLWGKIVSGIENIPTFLGKTHRKKPVKELKWEIGGYRTRSRRRWQIKRAADLTVLALAQEFGKKHGIEIRYASLSRLKTTESILDKIKKKQAQFERVFKTVKKTVKTPSGKTEEVEAFRLSYASIMRARKPDAKGREILDNFLLYMIWKSLRQKLSHSTRNRPLYERIELEFKIRKRKRTEKVLAANKISDPIKREAALRKIEEELPVLMIEKSVLNELIRRRVLAESIGTRLIFVPPTRFVENPDLLVFERETDKPYALMSKLDSLLAKPHDAEELVLEHALKERIDAGLTVGYHYDLDVPTRKKKVLEATGKRMLLEVKKGVSQARAGYSFDGQRERFVIRKEFVDALGREGEQIVLERLSHFFGSGVWRRNRAEETALQQVYDFINTLKKQKVQIEGSKKSFVQQIFRIRDFNKIPSPYGYTGVHVLLATPFGECEIQLRTLGNQKSIDSIDRVRAEREGTKSYK